MHYSSYELATGASLAVVFLCLIASLLLGFRAYQNTIPPVPDFRRRLLAWLRAASLFTIAFVLCQPLLVSDATIQVNHALVVLIDESESMGIKDALGVRSEIVKGLLSSRFPQRWRDSLDVFFVGFSSESRAIVPPYADSLTFKGAYTDITSALENVRVKYAERDLAGVVLVTDGQFNLGFSPSSSASSLGFPVYTVGVGDETESKDIVVDQIVANEIVYSGSTSMIQALLTSTGYADEIVEVELLLNGRRVELKRLQIGDNGTLNRIDFEVKPSEPGVFRWSVRVVPMPGEYSTRNNERSFLMNVLKDRVSVLLISGAPDPDHSFLYKVLVEDPTIKVLGLIERVDGTLVRLDGSETTENLEPEVYILNQFPTRISQSQITNQYLSPISSGNKPFMLFMGPQSDLSKLNTVTDRLPAKVEADAGLEEMLVPMATTVAGRNSTLLSVSGNASEAERQWGELPPVFLSGFVLHPKDKSNVLARVDMARSGSSLKIKKDLPLIISRQDGQSKSVAIGAHGLWKAYFSMQGLNRSNTAYKDLIHNTIHWLALKDDLKPFRIETSKHIYHEHEKIIFGAQVYDQNLNVVSDANVRLQIWKSDQKNDLELRPVANGRYEGNITLSDTGEFRFRGEGIRNQETLGSDEGRIYIEAYSAELTKTNLNEHLLKTVARESGGVYVRANDFENLETIIPAKSQLVYEKSEKPIWNHPFFLFSIVLLLSVEWFIRKRSDML